MRKVVNKRRDFLKAMGLGAASLMAPTLLSAVTLRSSATCFSKVAIRSFRCLN